MKVLIPMRDALADKALLANALPGASWDAWKVLLTAAAGEPLSAAERETFKRLTGRDREPGQMVEVMLTVAGRRSGKSKAMAVFAVWLATCCDWSDDLSLGELGRCLFLAPVERQADVVDDYVRAVLDHVELLRSLVEDKTAHVVRLKRSVALEVQPASAKHSRGMTAIGIVLDECAFLPSNEDAFNSDVDILTALRPSLSTTGAPLLLTSSPSTTTGICHSLWRKHYGAGGDAQCLVVQSDSLGLNPTLRKSVIDRAYEVDAAAAQAEWGGEFREPLSAFLDRATIMRCVEAGVSERAPLPGVSYACFIDSAGGSGTDSFSACVGHKSLDADRSVIVVDALYEVQPPFDPLAVVAALAGHLERWRITQVHGDCYSANFIVSAFAKHGIGYVQSKLDASGLYLAALPAFTSNTIALLDVPRAIEQLVALRRRIGQAGKESVQHMRGQHDDLANAICGLVHLLTPLDGVASSWQIPGVVTQPRLYFGDNSADTMQAWLRVQGNRNPFYAPQAGERSIHHGVPDPRVNALW
jgi:hypothetical protein